MSTQRTLSERDETYVGDIVRDENWLVNSSCTLSTPPNTITLHSEHKEVLRITADGRLVTGEGLSADEATQEAAKLLITSFEEQIQKMVEKRIAAEREKVRVLEEAAKPFIEYAKAFGACTGSELWAPNGTKLRPRDWLTLAATKEGSK